MISTSERDAGQAAKGVKERLSLWLAYWRGEAASVTCGGNCGGERDDIGICGDASRSRGGIGTAAKAAARRKSASQWPTCGKPFSLQQLSANLNENERSYVKVAEES